MKRLGIKFHHLIQEPISGHLKWSNSKENGVGAD